MWLIHTLVWVLGIASLSESYSKYGRTCKDIGCASYEKCVMKEDPCSLYQRNECGLYPTCERVSSSTHRTCSGFVCPPTMVCRMDGSNPKCVADPNSAGRVITYDTKNLNEDNSNNNHNQPSAPLPPGYHPPGGTTPRPNVYRPQNNHGGGYQGGQPGSGYPGQPGSGYPGQPNPYQGHNNQYNYNQGYPGYNNGAYNPNNRAGYPTNYNQGQQGNYPNGYYQNSYGYGYGYGGASAPGSFSDSFRNLGGQVNNRGGYPTNYNQGYGYSGGNPYAYNGYQNNYGSRGYGSGSTTGSDPLTDSLKSLGTDILKSALNRLINGNVRY